MADLRMNAYYYSFEPTGIPEVDLILSAVACAGKAFHHTESWTDECSYQPEGHVGATPRDWIQNAAIMAAKAFKEREPAPKPPREEQYCDDEGW